MMILNYYTTAALRALALAHRISALTCDGYIGSEHLLLGLLYAEAEHNTPCVAAKLLTSRGITAHAASAILGKPPLSDTMTSADPSELTAAVTAAEVQFTPVLARILSRAREEAQRFMLESRQKEAVIGSEHLLFSLLCETDAAAHHVLARQNLPLHELYGDVLSFLSAVTAEEAIFSGTGHADHDTPAVSAAEKNRPGTMQDLTEIPFLLDMTACAAAGKYDTVVGRDAEEETVLRILLHRQKNNPCLLGEAGVGKTAIVEGLAARIAHGTVPPTLLHARIYALDLGGMLAGAKYRGDFEDRMKTVLTACRSAASDAILFIDELHMLMGAGAAEGTIDAANLLKPALARGEIRVIGATTKTEYDKSVGRDGAMSRRFQTVFVEEPDEERACQMLSALKPKLEKHHGVLIPQETIRFAVSASVRCLPDYFLPDKAIDLLDDACAAVRTAAPKIELQTNTPQAQRDSALLSGNLTAAQDAVRLFCEEALSPKSTAPIPTVTEDDICRAAERRTGIVLNHGDDDGARLRSLEERLNAVIFGQEDAIAALADALRRMQAGLTRSSRPKASFLFYGPTGVGKTAVCTELAAILFDTPHAFLRFDMSEYREPHTVSRLIGAPPGYVGHDEGGILTAAVRHRPYALLLFDEIEKAHPDVRHLFLQLLDSGYLTDSLGNRVSFRHTIIVMTANDSIAATHPLGFSKASIASASSVLPTLFPSEFTARFDALIRFRPLTEEACARILRKQLASLIDRLYERGISLYPDDALIPFLYRQSPREQGARGLCRTAAQLTEPPIARALLDGNLKYGDSVRMVPDGDAVILKRQDEPVPTNILQ